MDTAFHVWTSFKLRLMIWLKRLIPINQRTVPWPRPFHVMVAIRLYLTMVTQLSIWNVQLVKIKTRLWRRQSRICWRRSTTLCLRMFDGNAERKECNDDKSNIAVCWRVCREETGHFKLELSNWKWHHTALGRDGGDLASHVLQWAEVSGYSGRGIKN